MFQTLVLLWCCVLLLQSTFYGYSVVKFYYDKYNNIIKNSQIPLDSKIINNIMNEKISHFNHNVQNNIIYDNHSTTNNKHQIIKSDDDNNNINNNINVNNNVNINHNFNNLKTYNYTVNMGMELEKQLKKMSQLSKYDLFDSLKQKKNEQLIINNNKINEQINEQHNEQINEKHNEQLNEQHNEQLNEKHNEQLDEQLNEQHNEEINEQHNEEINEQHNEEINEQHNEEINEEINVNSVKKNIKAKESEFDLKLNESNSDVKTNDSESNLTDSQFCDESSSESSNSSENTILKKLRSGDYDDISMLLTTSDDSQTKSKTINDKNNKNSYDYDKKFKKIMGNFDFTNLIADDESLNTIRQIEDIIKIIEKNM